MPKTAGLNMPKIRPADPAAGWLDYAENAVAGLCRKVTQVRRCEVIEGRSGDSAQVLRPRWSANPEPILAGAARRREVGWLQAAARRCAAGHHRPWIGSRGARYDA
jgi:hypothetical protein